MQSNTKNCNKQQQLENEGKKTHTWHKYILRQEKIKHFVIVFRSCKYSTVVNGNEMGKFALANRKGRSLIWLNYASDSNCLSKWWLMAFDAITVLWSIHSSISWGDQTVYWNVGLLDEAIEFTPASQPVSQHISTHSRSVQTQTHFNKVSKIAKELFFVWKQNSLMTYRTRRYFIRNGFKFQFN